MAASPAAALEQQPDSPSLATLRGTVVDARTGVPLPRVLVALEGGSATETGADGTFALERVAPGAARLYVAAVGYGLVQRNIALPAGGALDIRIPLAEGASTYTEEITVPGDRFLPPAPGVPSQQALGSADLQNLLGYYAKLGESYVVSERRNELRLPSYARLDVRVNRTLHWSRKRLTLFAEVLNVLNRENTRFNPPRVNNATGQATRLFESLVAVVPSAGVLLEFQGVDVHPAVTSGTARPGAGQ